MMIILGLTGSIGMGKTTASTEFRRIGIPVHSSDEAVHQMMSAGGEAVSILSEMFPAAVKKYGIDRNLVAQEVFSNFKVKRLDLRLSPLNAFCDHRLFNSFLIR